MDIRYPYTRVKFVFAKRGWLSRNPESFYFSPQHAIRVFHPPHKLHVDKTKVFTLDHRRYANDTRLQTVQPPSPRDCFLYNRRGIERCIIYYRE